MKELLVTLMLVIPAPDKMVDWTINEVPTQVQIIYKYGLEASYSSKIVPCHTKLENKNQILFKVKSDFMKECYLVLNHREPLFVRWTDQWLKVKEAKEGDFNNGTTSK
jgi:hypothetical protein